MAILPGPAAGPTRVPTAYEQPGGLAVSVDVLPPSPDPFDSLRAYGESTERDLEAARRQKARDYVQGAIRRWRIVDTAESALRRAHRKDLEFFASEQWPQHIRKQREDDGRPCLTINRLPGFVRQITNAAREAGQGIEVDPVDGGADPELSEVLMGLIQHIESNSDAEVAYATAVESQARIGRGWFMIQPEYADDNSFEQELRIKRIRNPGTVYMDPAYQELDGHDARFCLIVSDIPKDDYIARWGQASFASLTEFARVGERTQDWMPEGKVRVASYYTFEPVLKTICRLQNGAVYDQDALQKPEVLAALQQAGISPIPVQTRKVQGQQLTWALINAAEVLEGNDDLTGGRPLPGRYIPVFPVVGEEIDLDGLIDYRGVVRDAIGSQQASNYWQSAMTETVALMPRAPFIAEAGQIEGYEKEWRQANVKAFSVLPYKGKSIDGTLVPPPQRNQSEAPIQAMAALSQQAENNIRATAGFSYDTGAQEPRPETSGRAILARQRQGEVGNSHFQAHLSITLRHAGRVLLDLIPHYYDTPRIKRLLGRDGTARSVVIHAGNPDAAKAQALAQQIPLDRIYDLSVGRYDVRVKAGTSFATQRVQDREFMTQIIQAAPQLMQMIGDLYFESMDSPVSRRIAKRFEAQLPPQFKEDDGNGGRPALPPEFLQQAQQAQQLIDAQTKAIHDLTTQIETKALELQSRERIAQIQAETTIAVAESRAVTTNAIALLEARTQHIEQLINIDMARLAASQSLQQQAPAVGASGASTSGVSSPQPNQSGPTPGAPPSPETPEPAGSAGSLFAGPLPAPPGA
jgi:hypothetical protein